MCELKSTELADDRCRAGTVESTVQVHSSAVVQVYVYVVQVQVQVQPKDISGAVHCATAGRGVVGAGWVCWSAVWCACSHTGFSRLVAETRQTNP